MLDYKLLMRNVDEVDAQDHDDIRFNVSLWCNELQETHNTPCRFVRRPDGWGIRAELYIDDMCYHSATIRGNDTPDHNLVELYDALMSKRWALSDDARTQKLAWVDTMQDMMQEAEARHNA